MVLGAWLAASLLLGQEASSPEIRELVERLGAESITDREEALRRLKEKGKDAFAELRNGAGSSDLEIASRARFLLWRLSMIGRVGPRLKRAFPGIEQRIEEGEGRWWTEAFLEALESGKHPELEDGDLDALSGVALRSAWTSETKLAVCEGILRRNCRSAAEDLLLYVGDADAPVRRRALDALRVLGSVPPAAAPRIATLLDDEDPEARWNAVHVLIQLDARASFPEFVKLLGDEVFYVREKAAAALAGPAGKELLPAVARLLSDPSRRTREAALRVIAVHGKGEHWAAVAERLAEPSPRLRRLALEALRRIQEPAAGRAVVSRLADRDDSVRRAALPAVRDLAGKDLAPAVLGFLKHERPEVRRSAALLLSEWGVEEAVPELLRLLGSGSGSERTDAAAALARLGHAEGVEALLSAGVTFPLNALRRPATWARLRREKIDGLPEGSRGEILRSLARRADLALDAPASGDFRHGPDPGRRPLTAALEECLAGSGDVAVLEEDRLRLLGREEGLRFWRDWKAGR